MKIQTLDIKTMRESDIGRWVIYNNGFGEEEGRIKSWNDKNIFVVYKCDGKWDDYQNYTGVATRPQDLTFQ